MPIYLKNEAHLVGEMPNLIMLIQVILDLIKTIKAPADLQLSLKPLVSMVKFSTVVIWKDDQTWVSAGIRNYLKSVRASESVSVFCIVAMKLDSRVLHQMVESCWSLSQSFFVVWKDCCETTLYVNVIQASTIWKLCLFLDLVHFST